MKFQLKHALGIIIGVFIIVVDVVFFMSPRVRWFQTLIVLAILSAFLPYILDFFKENKRQKEIELKFLEFVRNLVGTVKAGIPIPKAIQKVAKEDYGALTPYVKKLSQQIEWGIPTHQALQTFSNDTNNIVIKRSVSIVIEAEKSGGNMEDVLEAVTNSVMEIKKIKQERKASVYSQTVQGYIIFFIFIIIMLVMQTKLLPPLTSLTNLASTETGSFLTTPGVSSQALQNMDTIFLSLILIQGFFNGVMIGKFAEDSIKAGLKHSLILMVLGYIIISLVSGG